MLPLGVQAKREATGQENLFGIRLTYSNTAYSNTAYSNPVYRDDLKH